MNNSELRDCGWSTTNFIDRMGLFINSDWASLIDNQITNSFMGVYVWECNEVNISGNTFDNIEHTGINVSANFTYVMDNQVSNAYIGIEVEDHNNVSVMQNTISSIEFRGINTWNSELITIDNNSVSSIGNIASSDTYPVGIYVGGSYNCSIANNTLTSVGDSNSGHCILTYLNSLINISYNDILNNPYAYGITIARGFNYFVYNNTLNNNDIGVFIVADGSVYTTTDCTIIDNEILNNNNGIWLQGVNGISAVQDILIYRNRIYSNDNAGIYLFGSSGPYAINYVFIRGNEIYSNGVGTGYGILLNSFTLMNDIGFVYGWDNSIRENIGPGYFLYRVDRIFIWDDYLYKNEENIWARSASNVFVENTTMVRGDGASDVDILADNLGGAGGKPSSVWFINTTFDKNNADVVDAGSFLNVSRYLHVRVVQGGAGVDNADVWVDDVFGNPGVHDPTISQPLSTGTGNDGWIRWLNVTEFNRTGTGPSSYTTITYTDHTVEASLAPGFGTNTTAMTQSKEVWVFLNNPPSVINLTTTAPAVYRGNTINITANGSDVEDPEDALTPYFERRAPGSGVWTPAYLGVKAYNGTAPTGHWDVTFSPTGTAPVGLYDIRVRFEDTVGHFSNWFEVLDLVRVLNNPPVADAGADFTVAAGHDFNFDGSNSTDDNGTGGLSYAWDMDDSDGVDWGSPDRTGITPLANYTLPGVYNVTLNVTDGDADWNISTVAVTVFDLDSPVANAGPDGQVKINSPYTFDASLSDDNVGIVWYNWSFGDGFYDNGTNVTPQHTYTALNTFVVILTCTDAAGNSATDTVNITTKLSDPPEANATAVPDNITDEDSPITLNGSNSTDDLGITNYLWDVDLSDGLDWADPDLSGEEVFWIYDMPGVYIVTLNVTDGDGGYDHDTLEIIVLDVTPPTPQVSVPPDIDEDTQYMYDGSGSSDNTGVIAFYNWTFGDGNISFGTDPQPTYEYAQPGDYTVILNVTDPSGNWATLSVPITVDDITPPDADAGLDNTTDEDSQVVLNASDSTDNYYAPGELTYKWDMDASDGLDWEDPDHTGVTAIHVYDTPNIFGYTVTLNVTDPEGNSGFHTITVIVYDITAPFADAGPNATIDEDTIHTLNGWGSSDNSGTVYYAWDIDSSDGVDWGSPDYTVGGPTVFYSHPKIYVATLNVTDPSGNWAIDTVVITVKDVTNPVAEAGPSEDSVNHGTEYAFNGTQSSDNSGSIAFYNWSFGDGNYANGTNPKPVHTYADPGDYVVILTVTDNAGNSATDTITIHVMDITNPHADAGPDGMVDEGIPYQFDGSGSSDDVDIVEYAWDMDVTDGVNWGSPDHSGPSLVDPVHVYDEPGVYTVTLRVMDGDGNWDTDTVNITVADITKPSVHAGSDATINEDTSYMIDGSQSSDNSGTIAFFNWSFGDGTYANDSVAQPFHTYDQPGVYVVNLTVADPSGNSNITSVQITVLDVTDPTADAGENAVWNEDSQYIFDGSGSGDNVGIANYAWDMNASDGLWWDTGAPADYEGPAAVDPGHTYPEPGNYTVTLKVTDGAGNWQTDTMVITVVDITKPDAVAGPDDSVNEDAAVTFNASGSSDNVGIVRYAWDFDSADGLDWGSPDYIGPIPSTIYSQPGEYIVTLNVTDSAGNWAMDTLNITVVDVTLPTADAGPNDAMDEDLPYTFNATGSGDNVGIVNYSWDMDASDGLWWDTGAEPDRAGPGMASPVYTYEEPGIYTVTLKVSDAEGNQATDTMVIEIRDVTPPSIFVLHTDPMDEDVEYKFNASGSFDNTGIASFNFSFGDGGSKFGTRSTVTYTYRDPGVYRVTITAVDAAGNTAFVIFDTEVRDTTPPSTPSGFEVSMVVEGEALAIAWEANSEPDFHHYELWVSDDGDNYLLLNKFTINTTSYLHTGLTNGAEYSYYLVAVDESGLSSEPTNTESEIPDRDFDGDGIFDIEDFDDDNDGVNDENDAFPYNPDEIADNDEDGIGDNADDDDDDDGVLDTSDAFPYDPTETSDFDSDGTGDNADPDDDNDGIHDGDDAYPLDPKRFEEPIDYFTYLLLLIAIIALIVAVALGAGLSKQKRKNREYSRQIQALEQEKAQLLAAPPAAVRPGPPPWMLAKTEEPEPAVKEGPEIPEPKPAAAAPPPVTEPEAREPSAPAPPPVTEPEAKEPTAPAPPPTPEPGAEPELPPSPPPKAEPEVKPPEVPSPPPKAEPEVPSPEAKAAPPPPPEKAAPPPSEPEEEVTTFELIEEEEPAEKPPSPPEKAAEPAPEEAKKKPRPPRPPKKKKVKE
ncbi:MAG: PKD domain-containing protein [Thermoplasmata archaeon]|nr:MAG: PKD domain-containing protein [Thermoplasmata archaeon]